MISLGRPNIRRNYTPYESESHITSGHNPNKSGMATFQIFVALYVVAPAGCFAAIFGWLVADNSPEERRY
jgi:hypothetical protein